MADHAPHNPGQAEAGAALEPDLNQPGLNQPGPNQPGLNEAGRLLFAQDCRFIAAADQPARIPALSLPEVAIAGRSNVGKSSLLNALTGRIGLARASRTPGRTRALLFFNLAGRLILVDLPGYGYAKAPKLLAREWQGLMLAYLRGRQNLRRVLLLIDARHPVSSADQAAMTLMDDAAVGFQIVLTKSDAVPPAQLAGRVGEASALARVHPAAHPEIVACSSRSRTGIAELRAALAPLAA